MLASRMAIRYPRLDLTTAGETDVSSGEHHGPPHHQSLLEWFKFWPKAGPDDEEYVHEFVPFDQGVGSWLD